MAWYSRFGSSLFSYLEANLLPYVVMPSIFTSITSLAAFFGIILAVQALRGRWRGLVVFTVILAALMVFTMIVVGWWLPDWIANLRDYNTYVNHLVWIPERISFLIIPVALIGWLIALLLIVPQTGSYFLVFLLPITVIGVQRASRLSPIRRTFVYGLVALFFLASWTYQPLDIETRKIEALLMPLHALIIWGAATLPLQPAVVTLDADR